MVNRDDWDDAEAIEFAPQPGPEPDNEGLNVLRVAGLSTLLGGDRDLGSESVEELQAFGFAPAVVDRPASGDDDIVDVMEAVFGYLPEIDSDEAYRQARIAAWEATNAEDHRPGAALAYLLLALGSAGERESVASAVALAQIFNNGPFPWYWDWHPRTWLRLRDYWAELGLLDLWASRGPVPLIETDPEFPDGRRAWDGPSWRRMSAEILDGRFGVPSRVAPFILVSARLALAERSSDPVTREYRHALTLTAAQSDAPPGASGADTTPSTRATVESTMIHGTRAWRGSWWRPGGDFHQHVLANVRTNLYKDGRRFSWSGLLSPQDRAQAASDISDWASGVKLDAVFAHSYGGEVASRAIAHHGVSIEHLVLLSTPRTRHVKAGVEKQLRAGRKVADVRLHFDIVLWLARHPFRLTLPGVTDVGLKPRYWSHSATHNPKVWTKENIASRAGL